MLKLLEKVKLGIENPSSVPNAVIAERIKNLDVSSLKQISPDETFTVSIQHLQADTCEGRLLLTGRSDGSVLLHNIKNTTQSLSFKCECVWKCGKHDKQGHRYSVECVRWFPNDDGIFVTAGFDKRLKIWDTSRLQCVETLSFKGKIFNFDLSPAVTRNCTVAACSNEGVVSIFELQSGTNVHTLKNHVGDVLACKWSPLNEYILATGGSDNKVLLWDIRSSRSCLMNLNRCRTIQTTGDNPCVNDFTAHTGAVNAFAFVKNGLKLISCGTDNMIRMWDTLTGKNELVDYESFSNGSKRSVQIDTSRGTNPEFVFVPCREGVNVYEVDSGKLVNSLKGHFNHVNCCFYEPFMHEVYSGCVDGLILVYREERLLGCDWTCLI